MTLLHEVERMGTPEDVGGMKYVYPPEANRPMRLPAHLEIFEETDGTQTLSGPLDVRNNTGSFVCYLIHGTWSSHRIGS
jgi:hypothetical protein